MRSYVLVRLRAGKDRNLGLLKEVRSSIEELKTKRFRVSDKIVDEALRSAGEKPINVKSV